VLSKLKHGVVALLGAILVVSCSGDGDTGKVAQINRSSTCESSMTASSGGGNGGVNYSPTATIVMKNDGGWCWFDRNHHVMDNVPVIPNRSLTVAPQHGQVILDVSDYRSKTSRYAYLPHPGFVGTDQFTVALSEVGRSFDIPVTVTVTK
jgi:hypothetical protein